MIEFVSKIVIDVVVINTVNITIDAAEYIITLPLELIS